MPKETTETQATTNLQLHNIAEISRLEQRDRLSTSTSDRIANVVTAITGRMLYVVIHIVWFTIWILWNTGLLGLKPFDAFPFSLLTMSVSLEAIFLSAFVLISQNRQALQADKRAKIDLQINMLAEQEVTKLIVMVAEIQQHLGLQRNDDADVEAMKTETKVHALADSLDEAEKKTEGKKPAL